MADRRNAKRLRIGAQPDVWLILGYCVAIGETECHWRPLAVVQSLTDAKDWTERLYAHAQVGDLAVFGYSLTAGILEIAAHQGPQMLFGDDCLPDMSSTELRQALLIALNGWARAALGDWEFGATSWACDHLAWATTEGGAS